MLKWQVGITAEAKPIAEEVVEINSSEVSAPEAVVPPEPAAVDVAEEKETLQRRVSHNSNQGGAGA